MEVRHHEILFYHNIEHLKAITTNDKIPLLLEMLAMVFDIDLTNLHILYNQYMSKFKPSLKEVALMARDLQITVRRFPIQNNYGYRLIRNNRDVKLSPVLYNESLIDTVKTFNQKYLAFSSDHLPYIKEIVDSGIYKN